MTPTLVPDATARRRRCHPGCARNDPQCWPRAAAAVRQGAPAHGPRLVPGARRRRTRGFDDLVAEYDRSVPFRRRGQYERHRQTIDCRLELGSARAAIGSPVFSGLLYETLQLWGIGRRASRLVPLDAFRDRLVAVADAINALDGLCIESAGLDADAVAASLDRLVSDLGVVDNKALWSRARRRCTTCYPSWCRLWTVGGRGRSLDGGRSIHRIGNVPF
jgi:hypothetical protein